MRLPPSPVRRCVAMRPERLLAATAAAAVLVLGGCGDGESGGTDAAPAAASTAPNGDVVNAADVTFATDMIPHHAQALVMVDLTLGRDLDPRVAQVMEEIRSAQGPEIETMADWLDSWGEPVPATSRDHANAHSDDHGTGSGDGSHAPDGSDQMAPMPGMLSGEELDALEQARGAEFETMLLAMMIEHHRGAIEMARAEVEDGAFEPARDLAGEVARAQQREILTMEKLLDRLA